jgi:hypothetical protein
MKKTEKFQFGVNSCSLCEDIKLTLGQQKWGGIRYCQECLKETLGWFQSDEQTKANVTKLFELANNKPQIIQSLKDVEKLTPGEKKSISIGESKRRLFESLKYG